MRLAFFAAVLLAAAPAFAHHSFAAEYDGEKPITLKGVVTKVEWENPHMHFYLDETDDKGKVEEWKFEGFPPNMLVRQGWKRDVTLKQGDSSQYSHGKPVTYNVFIEDPRYSPRAGISRRPSCPCGQGSGCASTNVSRITRISSALKSC